jgi:hypothetical protein
MTILYVNGDSHSAAAEVAGPWAFAEDDGMYWGLGRQPHPDNLRASYGCELANHLNAILVCDAESASCNARIIRTTKDWINANSDQLNDVFIVIQWSTWEREEWFHDNTWYQVNASGADIVPEELKNRYKQFVIDVDWTRCTESAHCDIWEFHCYLNELKIPHLFFNGNTHFGGFKLENNLPVPIIAEHERKDWGVSYINPYDVAFTYNFILKDQGFSTVNPDSYHFGADAHCFWGEYLLQYIKNNNLIP